MSNTEEKRVVRDLTEAFNDKVSHILEEIDMFNKELMFNPNLVVPLNERLNALFKKLHPKMVKFELTKHIERELMFKKRISHIKLGKQENVMTSDGVTRPQFTINPHELKLYKFLLEKREIHLNEVLELIGLTASHKKDDRVIY